MNKRLEATGRKVARVLAANDGIVMLGSLSAVLGETREKTCGIVQLLGYEVQDWGGIEYITDDNSEGIIT